MFDYPNGGSVPIDSDYWSSTECRYYKHIDSSYEVHQYSEGFDTF